MSSSELNPDQSPRPPRLAILPILALLIVALVLRFHDLPGRVMHTDEAIHAVTVGKLLAGTPFVYNPKDFHGPTLQYSTIPVALARGQTGFSKLDESTLRGVCAGYGVVLVFLVFAFRRELGTIAACLAAWLTAISPMMVFFSRYYIMEIPFAVFLTIFALCLWRWIHTPRLGWLVGSGISLGLLHATKETFVIHIAALIAAATFAQGKSSIVATVHLIRSRWLSLIGMVFLAFLVSAALLSHGFHRPEAILDGIKTYLLYFQRSSGTEAGHAQPWHYYFTTLFSWKPCGGFLYSELGILLLGIAGATLAFLKPTKLLGATTFHRGLALYTIFTSIVYSIIPYKTPWSFLATTHGWILLAAITLASLLPIKKSPLGEPDCSLTANTPPRQRAAPAGTVAFAAILLALVTTHALLYNQKIIVSAPADPRQPMVYGHTCQEVLGLVKEIEKIQTREGRKLKLSVSEAENGWPLPWYRRKDVGNNSYGNRPPNLVEPADVVVVSRGHFAETAEALLSTHLCQSYDIRPGAPIHVFIRRSLVALTPTEPTIQAVRSN